MRKSILKEHGVLDILVGIDTILEDVTRLNLDEKISVLNEIKKKLHRISEYAIIRG